MSGRKWHAAICYNARSVATVLRETLIELDYDFTREKTEQRYSKIMFMLPLPNMAYVYRFMVNTDSPFIIDIYDTRPTHSGVLHLVSLFGIDDENFDDIKRIFHALVDALPRKPWKFFWSERFRTGLIKSEYLLAKKRWRQLGFAT